MKDIKFPNIDKRDIFYTEFEGTPYYSLTGMKYLKNNYKNAFIVIPSLETNIKKHTDISIRWIQIKNNKGYIKIPPNFWDIIYKYLQKMGGIRFIVFPFGFSCNKGGGHSNYFIYDCKSKTLERFDSIRKHNSKCVNVKDIDDKLKDMFSEYLGNGFIHKYLKPFKKYAYFQEVQDKEREKIETDPEFGFCSAWSLFWVELRLLNPDIEREELIQISLDYIKKSKLSLTQFIRSYSNQIVSFSKKYKKV
jgi:hypothetical protein